MPANPPCVTTGINKLNSEEDILMYPNPATKSFFLKLNTASITNIEISSMDGKVIYKNTVQPDENLTEINISDFAPGIYLVRLTDSSKMILKKLVIEK